MSALMRYICCCKANEDEQHLIPEDDAGRSANMQFSDSSDHFWVGNTVNASTNTNTATRTFKPGDEEDELLNQILETAQQNIIDVGNIDGTMTPCKEDMSMAQWYMDAIKQHDLIIRKHGSVIAEADECLHSQSVLFDVGARAVEILQEDSKPLLSINEIRDYAKRLNESVTKGIKVKHTHDILVHMSFSDD